MKKRKYEPPIAQDLTGATASSRPPSRRVHAVTVLGRGEEAA